MAVIACIVDVEISELKVVWDWADVGAPGVSLEVRSRELALLTVLGLKRLLSVLAESCKGSCTDRESCLPAKLEEMFKVPSKISRG